MRYSELGMGEEMGKMGEEMEKRKERKMGKDRTGDFFNGLFWKQRSPVYQHVRYYR